MKRVLIACECSQVETKVFREYGYDAYSCDIKDCYGGHPEWHIKGDCLEVLKNEKFDCLIAHPPCTYLTLQSRICLYPNGILDKDRYEKMIKARDFFLALYNQPIKAIAIENPRPLKEANLPYRSFYCSPEYFGHDRTKRTYFWTKGLPPLISTCFVIDAKHFMEWGSRAEGRKNRQEYRCEGFEGIARAMANQWYNFI